MGIGVPTTWVEAARGRWSWLSSLLSKGDWCKKHAICVASSIERGHKKTCRLQNHQDPGQKRLGCVSSVQIKIDGVLWAAVIIIADAEEDCWDVSWLTCGCLQLVFIPWKWCSRRKADPAKTRCGYEYKHRLFIPSLPSVLQGRAGVWLCGLCGLGTAVPAQQWHLCGAFMHFLQWGVQATISSQICPQDLFMTTCDLQYDPLTLLLVGFLFYMICCSHGWALTWSWDLQCGLCRTPNSTKQFSLGVNILDFYWPKAFITERSLFLYHISGWDHLNITCIESVSRGRKTRQLYPLALWSTGTL